MATKEKVVAEPTTKDLLLSVLNELLAQVEDGSIESVYSLRAEALKALNNL